MSWLIAFALQAGAEGAAADCQAAIGDLYDGPEIASLPNQVDGATIQGAAGLARLRIGRSGPIIVNGGKFAGIDLRRARLSNICFVGSDLAGSDWRGVQAPGLAFIDTSLEGAKLTGARLPRILLRQANLKNVDASGADLSGGKMDGGWDGSVENLRLDRAKLVGFRFECGITIGDGCPLNGDMRLAGADLTRASLATYFRFSDWAGARIDGTELSLAQLVELDRADLRGPIRLRGGDTVAEISPAEFRALRPQIRQIGAPVPPSFDCGAARSAVERAICSEEGLSVRSQDAGLASLFRRARALHPAAAAEQQSWLRRRDRCGTDLSCISAAYDERRGALLGRIGPPAWVRPGAVALFVAPDILFDEAFKSRPLYRRLLPVLIDGASGRVVVRVRADGALEAAGDAVGGNAHLCSLAADRLTFDSRNGWYSGPHQDDADTPRALRGGPMPVLRFEGDWVEVYRGGQGGFAEQEDPRGSEYASCGARASFGDMVRVPVTEAEAAALLRSYAEQ